MACHTSAIDSAKQLSALHQLTEIVRGKSAHMPALRPVWQSIAQQLREMSPEDAIEVLGALPTPRIGHGLIRLLGRADHPDQQIKEFLSDVRASDESLESWIAALGELLDYMETRPARPTLAQMSGYLHCCLTVVESGPRYADFPQTVKNLLETYGFAGEATD